MLHYFPVNANLILRHESKWLESCDYLAHKFSTCAKRQYFAVIVSPNKRVVGMGYNGSPPGMAHCVDGACPRLAQGSSSGSSYDNCISQHAEQGALLWSDPALRQGSTLIVNGPPCMGCAKLIASSGVSRIVHYNDASYENWPQVLEFLQMAGLTVTGVDR